MPSTTPDPIRPGAPVCCDLDGVVWLAHVPIPGSVDAIERLRNAGHRVLFVTNNSAATTEQHEAALAEIGVDAVGDVVSSSHAAAALVHPGERVLVGGGPGIVEAVTERGAVAVLADADGVGRFPTGFDAVTVGLDRGFNYDRLAALASAVRAGARLIATNDDATYPTPDGLLPGGGSIVAAVAAASGQEPIIAGKPHQAMADAVAARLGVAHPAQQPGVLADAVMIGDRTSTDGRFADALGCRFALVRSGVTAADQTPDVPVSVDAANLAAVVDVLLADR